MTMTMMTYMTIAVIMKLVLQLHVTNLNGMLYLKVRIFYADLVFKEDRAIWQTSSDSVAEANVNCKFSVYI